jgi:hypothetical protein
VVSRTWARAWSRHGQWLAPVAGLVGGAWAASAGVGVMSVACWLGPKTAETAGSSGAWGTWSGDFFRVSWSESGQGRQGADRGEAGALLGGQRLGLGLPTTVANSCFDFV